MLFHIFQLLLVERCKNTYVQTNSDRTYLMYDLDVPSMLERLMKVSGVTLLCSNPCFELWLLLHYTDQRTELSSSECVKRLATFLRQYKKGVLRADDRFRLISFQKNAASRAKNLKEFFNPSSTVYRLIDDLESLKVNHQYNVR